MITLDLKWASVLLDYERGPKKYVVKVVLSLQQKLTLFCMSLNNFLLGTDHLSFVAEWGGEGVSGQFLLSSFLSFFLSFGTSPRGNHKNTTNRAVAMCFVTGGHYHECPRHEPCCFEPQKIFKFGGSETLFSAFVIDCKTVRILAYSSTREQSNKRAGTRLKTESETGERR